MSKDGGEETEIAKALGCTESGSKREFEQKMRELGLLCENDSSFCVCPSYTCAFILESWPYALDLESSLPYWELRTTHRVNH